MKLWNVAVTFERPDTGQPQTWRGTVSATRPTKATSLAIAAARKAIPRIQYDSICILLEPQKAA